MSTQLSKSKRILFYLAIIMTNVIVMHDYVIVPIVNTFYELFPDHVAGVNFIVSGPAIIMFLASLTVPYLLKFMSKKILLSIVCGVFTVSALLEAAVVSLPYMIFTRSVCGFCYGVVQVTALDIAAEFFGDDENRRAAFMGIYNAGMAGIGAVMGVVAGNLAVTGWKNAYATYLLAIPMTILVWFFVPKTDGQAVTDENEAGADEEKTPMGIKFWIMLLTFVLFNICYTPMMSMASVYIAEHQLGTEALAGMSASAGTVGSAIFCLAFGFLYGKLKARTSLISYVLMMLGHFAMYFLPGRMMILAVCAWCGAGYGMLFSYIYAQAPSVVAPQNISKAISYITAGTGFAMFVGTYVTTGLMGLLGTSMVTPVTLVFGFVLLVCLILEFVNTSKM